jgi:hypothetical protein
MRWLKKNGAGQELLLVGGKERDWIGPSSKRSKDQG